MSTNFKKIDINELIEKAERNSNNHAFYTCMEQFTIIEKLIEQENNYHNEILKYSLISLITCLEVFFRNVICDFIDYNSIYFKNINNFRNIDFNFAFINALTNNKLSVGQFIANALPISSFENIVSHMDKILGENFLEILEKIKYNKMEIKKKGIILKNPNEIYSDLKEMYKCRHICAHEFIDDEIIDKIKESIINWLKSSYNFINATQHLVDYKINPTVYMTQAEMNDFSSNEYLEINEKIKPIINKIKNSFENKLNNENYSDDLKERIKENLDDFINSEKSWQEYSKTSAKMIANNLGKGGSIWNLIYTNHLTDLANSRLLELKEIEDNLINAF